MEKVEKVMKVTLTRSRKPTNECGKLFQQQDWEIPYDSLEKDPKKSPLERQMLNELHSCLPEVFRDSVDHLLYGDLSSGGTLGHGEYTLKVSFAKPDTLYNY